MGESPEHRGARFGEPETVCGAQPCRLLELRGPRETPGSLTLGCSLGPFSGGGGRRGDRDAAVRARPEQHHGVFAGEERGGPLGVWRMRGPRSCRSPSKRHMAMRTGPGIAVSQQRDGKLRLLRASCERGSARARPCAWRGCARGGGSAWRMCERMSLGGRVGSGPGVGGGHGATPRARPALARVSGVLAASCSRGPRSKTRKGDPRPAVLNVGKLRHCEGGQIAPVPLEMESAAPPAPPSLQLRGTQRRGWRPLPAPSTVCRSAAQSHVPPSHGTCPPSVHPAVMAPLF